ncbi:cyclase family protein [Ktedonobacter sp. SOSP1-85]|uniref:cyclase family protein n=1 Tax=Ktedonobacter sp. SOSP1-85 TaxID=2778367 RepID=UPI0019163A08|nr:cyclase family protein [Ktedonobacter sp. SOSP1-85]
MASIQALAQVLNSMQVVDLSPTFSTNMPGWHAHPNVMIVEDARNFAQNGYFLQTIILPEHSGSHVDAPAHTLPDKAEQTIDIFPANALFGPAKKIDLTQENYAPGDLVPLRKVEEVLQQANIGIEKGDIVVFDFGYDKYLIDGEKKPPHQRNWWGENEPGLAEDVCRFLSETGIKAVGSDTPACDVAQVNGKVTAGFGHGRYFLPNGIFIIEGLYGLAKVPTSFYFMALPLKIKGGSGSPLRPIALFDPQ